MLKPDHSVHRFLVSTTSRFVGEYELKDLLITHAWQMEQPVELLMENPFSRSYFMVSAIIPEQEEAMSYPSLSIDPLLVCLSVLYGKRFDFHGAIEGHGLFRVPVLASNEPNLHPKIGFNNHQSRSNFSVELNLSQLEIMRPLFDDDYQVDPRVRDIFFTAGNFYLQALQRYGTHPESAYLDLITCGEILSNFYAYTDNEMYDVGILQQFATIEAELTGGDAIVRNLKRRLFQVSRRFLLTLMNLLTPDFCANNEVGELEHYGALEPETLEKRIKAAYQVRSMYVHTGKRFGREIQTERWERPLGLGYAVDEGESQDVKEFYKALHLAPTFKGLERLMRFCLLRFLETNGAITFPNTPEETLD